MNRRDLVRALVGAIALRYAPLAQGLAPRSTWRTCEPPLDREEWLAARSTAGITGRGAPFIRIDL